MNDYSRFNVSYIIGGIEFVDCRAFYKALNGQWRRVGADEYNNIEFCLNCNQVETIAIEQGFDIEELYAESDLFGIGAV